MFVITALWLEFTHAYEVDNFTNRYKPLNDSVDILNTEVNARLQEAVKNVNEKGLAARLKNNLTFDKSCSTEDLYSAVRGELAAGIIGALESFAEKNKAIAKSNPKEEGAIYSGSEYKGAMLAFAGIAASINIKGHYIGIDKLGHFFDQGEEYYRVAEKTSGSMAVKINAALAHGKELEEGGLGLRTTGVKSYGDLAANYEGYRFWSQLVTGINPYFKCSNGKWAQVRDFDWSHYVNPAWDEAVNCSGYTQGFSQDVKRAQENLEFQSKNKRKFVCPVSITQCRRMITYYADKASQIIGPTCLNQAKMKSVTDKDDYYSIQPISAVGANPTLQQSEQKGTSR